MAASFPYRIREDAMLRRIRWFSLPVLLIAVVLWAGSAMSEDKRHTLAVPLQKKTVRLISGVVFSQPSMIGYKSVPLRMDILQPVMADKNPMPAVLFVTGGGFITANKDNWLQQRLAIAEAGYVVASIEYRVAPLVLFPAPLEDVKAGIRFLRANAAKYGVDPERVAVMGDSAGGYLAAFAGVTSGDRKFDVGENLDQSSAVLAAVDIYGLSDLTLIGEGYPAEAVKMHQSPGATEALWVNGALPFMPGGSIEEHPEKAAAANPITYVKEGLPPFLIMHGDKDTLVSPRQTERLHEALVAKGNDSTYYVVKGANHGDVYWNQPEVVDVIIKFLDRNLKDLHEIHERLVDGALLF